MIRTVLFALPLAACADVTAIEDGVQIGAVVQKKDLFTSFAVIETDDGPLLVDAGWRPRKTVGSLKDLGYAPDDVQSVLITHGHEDHIGALEELTRATAWGLPGDEALFTEVGLNAPEPLVDGETREFGGVQVEVLAMPGHTAGSAAYLIDGALLLGDAALLDGDGQLVPVPADRSDDPEGAVEALIALAERLGPRADEIEGMIFSHSGPAEGLDALLDFADSNID